MEIWKIVFHSILKIFHSILASSIPKFPFHTMPWFLCLISVYPVPFLSVLCRYCTFICQRWSRGHKTQGQRHKKNPRPRTALPWTDPLEAKDTSASVISKKVFKKIFQPFSRKKRLPKFFSGNLQNLNNSKSAVLEPRTGQFSRTGGLETKHLTLEAKDFKMCPPGQGRPRGLHL